MKLLCFIMLHASCGGRSLPARRIQFGQTDYEGNVLMAWTPRAASTTALEIWAMYLGLYAHFANSKKEIHAWTRALSNGAKKTDFTNATLWKFKVVMNPFHRAVTMYQHAMWTGWYVKPCKRMRSVQQLLVGKAHNQSNMTFLQFLRVQRRAYWVIQKCNKASGHLQMQTAVHEGKVWKLDYVCRIETLETCLAVLSAATNKTWKLPPTNSSVSAKHNTVRADWKGDAASTGFTKFNRIYPEAEQFYMGKSGIEAAELVRELYAPDFNYGYDRSRPDDWRIRNKR